MKKFIKDITVLTLVGLLTACQQGEILTDSLNQGQPRQTIGFVGGYIDSPVKAVVTSLSDHMKTMGVYGWQKYESDPESLLFNDQLVSYSDSSSKWEYSPVKYWDDKTTYRFYAYAPHDSEVSTATVDFNSESHFEISGITLKGDNVMYDEARRCTLNNFSSVEDIDWLIDRNGQCGTRVELNDFVTFNMQHILSKLTVMIRTTFSDTQGTNLNIRLDSLKIGELTGKADFRQKLNHNPSSSNPEDMLVSEWSIPAGAPTHTIQSARNVDVDFQGHYIIESLIIPQDITAQQTVDMYYSMEYEAGNVETFRYRFALEDVFDQFIGGTSYMLTLTIGANVITFDSGVSEWDTNSVNRTM